MQFRKDINGLRALAVISVVLFHFNDTWLPGGFAGVDVFFVISGFLMTGIIFSKLEHNTFSLTQFYIARANRIIPALTVLCLAMMAFGWFYLTPVDYSTLGKHVGSSLSFFSNITYWQESGYFEAGSHEKWLLHTWSLSAEWQFYLLYPILLIALNKALPFKHIKTVILITTLLGFLLSVWVTYKWPTAAYYLLPTRSWEMLLGGLAYLYPLSIKERNKGYVFWLGLALIICSFLFLSGTTPWPGYFALLPVLGTFLIIQVQSQRSFLMNNIVSQALGRWSYSIYLWHWPIAVFIYSYSLPNLFNYLGIALAIFMGFLSYRYIERFGFRKHFQDVRDYSKCLPLYMMVLVSVLGFSIHFSKGVDISVREISATSEAEYLTKYHRDNYKKKIKEAYTFDRKLLHGQGGIFIWGDSHAQALSYGIRKVFSDVTINQITAPGCRALIQKDTKTRGSAKVRCDKANHKAQTEILKIKPKVILVAQRRGHDENDYFEISNFLRDNGLDSKLVIVGPVPQWQPSLPNAIAKRHFSPEDTIINDRSFVSNVFSLDTHLKNKYAQSEIHHISLIDQLCSELGCLAKVDNRNTPLVWDYGHLSLEGSIFVAENFIKQEISSFFDD